MEEGPAGSKSKNLVDVKINKIVLFDQAAGTAFLFLAPE